MPHRHPRDLALGCLDSGRLRAFAHAAGVCVALCAEIAVGGVVAGAATAVGTAARTGAAIIVQVAGGAGLNRQPRRR